MVAINSVILAYFDNLIGPKELLKIPETISQELLEFTLSSILNYFYLDNPPKERPIYISLTNWKKKALLYILRQLFPNARKGYREFMLIILFDEKDDAILYQYEHDISPLSQDYLNTLLQSRLASIKDILYLEEHILNALNKNTLEFIDSLNKKLNELSQIELNTIGQIQFPESTPQSDSKNEITFKSVVIGDPSVGKTSTIIRFTNRAFRRSYIPTVGANITEKIVEKPSYKVSMMIWDLAGHNKFNTVRSHYYSGAAGILLLFDLTNLESFASIPNWFQDITKILANQPKIIILVGNKVDLVKDRKVTSEMIQDFLARIPIPYIETSAKSGVNIDTVFDKLIDMIINKQ